MDWTTIDQITLLAPLPDGYHCDSLSSAEVPALRRLAQRLAHANAVANLVVFAALVLGAHALGVSSALIATACMVFFWARVVHALAYNFAVP